MAMTGFADGPPTRGGGALADFVGGLYLAVGILAGLRDRDVSGKARALDLSNQDAVFAVTDSALTIFKGIGDRFDRVGNQHPFTAPYDAFATRDGWVVVATASNRLFRPLMDAIGRSELASDERFRSHRGRAQHRTQINAIVGEWIAQRSTDEVLALLGPEGADVPVAQVQGPAELADDPQLHARDMLERHAHPSIGEIYFHGNPLKFSDAHPREIALAPPLGEANDDIYGALGLDSAALRRLAEDGVI
jgi:crotonobetainyl-CoA:carnitine CoA-transferase CaiB-like acyl-CoA transferase